MCALLNSARRSGFSDSFLAHHKIRLAQEAKIPQKVVWGIVQVLSKTQWSFGLLESPKRAVWGFRFLHKAYPIFNHRRKSPYHGSLPSCVAATRQCSHE